MEVCEKYLLVRSLCVVVGKFSPRPKGSAGVREVRPITLSYVVKSSNTVYVCIAMNDAGERL